MATLLDQSSETDLDTGTGYGIAPPTYDPKLIKVGPGTPMGETMRRYWHPIARTWEATETPKRVRLLGENLILFRDGEGRPGLVQELCCHRGASLFYGRVEEDGIRCCYHGWKFDVKGHCIAQPFEPEGGNHRTAARQPWYPVQEQYGLIWAYLGPPEKKPVLPRYEALEIPEDSTDVLENKFNPGWNDDDGMPFNWMHCHENAMDPYHVPWLHFMHSGPQFVFDSDIVDHGEVVGNAVRDGIKFEESPMGALHRNGPIVVDVVFPNIAFVPGLNDYMIVVPIDDDNCRMIQIARVNKEKEGDLDVRRIDHQGKEWKDLTPEELQKMPGDGEAMKDIPASGHSWEHLATTDRGVTLMRRIWNREVDKVMRGEDPLNVHFDPSVPPLKSSAALGLVKKA